MKVIIRTNIKNNENIDITDSFEEIEAKYLDKNKHVVVTKVNGSFQKRHIIPKSAIRLIKEQ